MEEPHASGLPLSPGLTVRAPAKSCVASPSLIRGIIKVPHVAGLLLNGMRPPDYARQVLSRSKVILILGWILGPHAN